MIVGIIGSGGREHAICHALNKSKKIDKIYCFPGNAGTDAIADNINLDINKFMERIRKKYICNNQIKKGIGGLKELIKLNNQGFSTALMIDQRVSQGIKSNFFNEKAFTTTIPAQLIKKFDMPVVPIFIERYEGIKFKMKVLEPIHFSKQDSIENITNKLNNILEKMILANPNNWIWSHNRWK